MTTLINTAIESKNTVPSPPAEGSTPSSPILNRSDDRRDAPPAKAKTERPLKHIRALHTRSEPSCLSSDSEKFTSYAGFRNLMVLVLSTELEPALTT